MFVIVVWGKNWRFAESKKQLQNSMWMNPFASTRKKKCVWVEFEPKNTVNKTQEAHNIVNLCELMGKNSWRDQNEQKLRKNFLDDKQIDFADVIDEDFAICTLSCALRIYFPAYQNAFFSFVVFRGH